MDEEMFGEARLVELLRAHVDAEVDVLLETVFDTVAEFGPNGLEDDLTLLVARGC